MNVRLGAPTAAEAEKNRACTLEADVTAGTALSNRGVLVWEDSERLEKVEERLKNGEDCRMTGVGKCCLEAAGVLLIVLKALAGYVSVMVAKNLGLVVITFDSAPDTCEMALCQRCILQIFRICDTS